MDDSTSVPSPADPRDARIAELEAKLDAALKRIAELEAIIEKLTRGGKRQAAPFSKGLPKLNPKKPDANRAMDTAHRRHFVRCPSQRRPIR